MKTYEITFPVELYYSARERVPWKLPKNFYKLISMERQSIKAGDLFWGTVKPFDWTSPIKQYYTFKIEGNAIYFSDPGVYRVTYEECSSKESSVSTNCICGIHKQECEYHK